MDWQPHEDVDRPVYRDEADIFNAMDERQRSTHNEYMIQCKARRDETQRKKEEEERRVKRKREFIVTRTDAYTELKKAFDETKDENKAIKGDLITIKEENNTLREEITTLKEKLDGFIKRGTLHEEHDYIPIGELRGERECQAYKESYTMLIDEMTNLKETNLKLTELYTILAERTVDPNTVRPNPYTTPVEASDTYIGDTIEHENVLKRRRVDTDKSTQTKECVSCKCTKSFSSFERKSRRKNKEGSIVDYKVYISMCHSCRNKKYRSNKKDKPIQ